MRPRSMTGFGRGEVSAQGKTWTVEIRTVNHRFLDQRVTLPRLFSALEEPIKKIVAASIDRGRVEVTLGLQGENDAGMQLVVNDAVAGQYHQCLQRLIGQFDLAGSVELSHMLTMRDIITLEEQNPDLEAELQLITRALQAALQACDTMREEEGRSLQKDLLTRLANFESIVKQIESSVPDILLQRQADLEQRVNKLLAGMDIDPVRLAQETAVMADKSDVTEELVRIASHIDQFRSFFKHQEPIGRRLDFLLQEFLREVNTLCSKITNASIAHLGVELKNEVEKLREQVQNIE